MPIIKQTLADQAAGAFDGGRILEKKPIGFPQDGGRQKPFSNLFYWAHAWSDDGGLIGEHPHQGFEIMSFVLTGTIEHYDSQLRGWKLLKAGDVQIIRSGNGITHAEKINKDSSIFQIWFDPDLSKTLGQPASYDDYSADKFTTKEQGDVIERNLVGESPIKMQSKVTSIRELNFKSASTELNLNQDHYHTFFILKGLMKINGDSFNKGDHAIIYNEDKISINDIASDTSIFMIEIPKDPGFLTYARRAGWTSN